jgi:lysylphosphatidylglycerol synthetase-like protein (DUF2156 family)
MESPERRSHLALIVTLLACGCGWVLLKYAPPPLPGEAHARLDMIQHFVAWWPLALIAAFGLGLTLPKLAQTSSARLPLLIVQWLLTYASVALIAAILFEVFFPRPT